MAGCVSLRVSCMYLHYLQITSSPALTTQVGLGSQLLGSRILACVIDRFILFEMGCYFLHVFLICRQLVLSMKFKSLRRQQLARFVSSPFSRGSFVTGSFRPAAHPCTNLQIDNSGWTWQPTAWHSCPCLCRCSSATCLRMDVFSYLCF